MRLVVYISLLCSTVIAIPKKQILLGTKSDQPNDAQEIKLNDVDLKLYQTDVQQDNHLKQENTNRTTGKSTVITQLFNLFNYFEILLSKQQQFGVFLVCLICLAFYLIITLKYRSYREKECNKKKMIQKQQQEHNVIILTDSIFGKEQSNQPLISTIIGSIIYEERLFRNKSTDDLKNKQQIPILKRSNSQPFLNPQHPDYSAEEIHNLLKDIN